MKQPLDLADGSLRLRATAAARGDRPFDLLIRGGVLIDMVTGEHRPADIGIVGPLIASVHAPGTRSDGHEVLDVTGAFLSPGLIDTHMHVESSMVTPATYCDAVLAHGVTTVVWDPHEFANVHGIPGVDYAIRATEDLPLRFVVLAPSCVPSAPGQEHAGADFDAATVSGLLARPEVPADAHYDYVQAPPAVIERAGTSRSAAPRTAPICRPPRSTSRPGTRSCPGSSSAPPDRSR